MSRGDGHVGDEAPATPHTPALMSPSARSVADVVFDAPVEQPFSYRVPDDMTVGAGQRVAAPLGGAERVGLVVGVREESVVSARLRPITRLVDAAPLLGPSGLEFARFLAGQSLTSFGSTALALLPPPGPGATSAVASAVSEAVTPESPLVLSGSGRERRLLDRLAGPRVALVITSDVESAGRWAQRLEKLARVARLDSGADDAERAAGWHALATGRARLAVGTRSALLTPLPAGATVALIDEHEAAHKPPGPPRLHSRDVILERGAREALSVVFTSATPSVEMWWRCESEAATLASVTPARWPAVTIADPRGITRREALTPPVSRAMREALAAGRRVFLEVSRVSSGLGCDECGAIFRCDRCGVAFGWSAVRRTLTCWLCGAGRPPMDTCPQCGGRRLTPFGWGVERVEQSVRRRFPSARIARYDPEARRGRRGEDQRAAAAGAEVVIGTRGALKLFGPGALGLAAFISPDQLLGLPDFRAAEHTFALLWAAAERVHPEGELIVQSRNPSHYALEAVAQQDLATFYRAELKFRAELGYPPFRRLAVIVVRPRGDGLVERVTAALAGARQLVAYPPIAIPGRRGSRIVVKGGPDLPQVLAAALGDLLSVRRQRPGIMEVEVDPVEWPF
ncbi:MAG TPA: primosomal protein N' [Candidatus Acidoferrum sp.]|nr:primosomal protein N' [Candidatus Acidoferrum sp.]